MGTAVDPKPNLHGSGLILVGWIRIPLGWETGPRWQKLPTRKEKVKKGIVLTCWMFSLRAEESSCSLHLEILHGGLGRNTYIAT
jgi:hypothetical protein